MLLEGESTGHVPKKWAQMGTEWAQNAPGVSSCKFDGHGAVTLAP